MPKFSPWLTIGSVVLTTGLLVDNLRLRSQINDQEESSAISKQSQSTKKVGSPAHSTTMKSIRTPKQRHVPVSIADDLEDEIQARVEEEVEARIEEEVEVRIDSNLDALVEERVDQRLEEHHDRRKERHRAAIEEHVTEFVANHGHSSEVEAQMVTILEDGMSNMGEIFRAIHKGEIERESAREEMNEIREEIGSSLDEILGDEESTLFQEGLRGPLGRRGPR